MEKPLDQHLLGIKQHQGFHQRGKIHPPGLDLADVVDTRPLFKAHNQGIIAAQEFHRNRKTHPDLAVGLAEEFEVSQLLGHADFLANDPGKRRQYGFDRMTGLVGKQRTKNTQKQIKQNNIDLDLDADIPAQQFDRYFLSAIT